MPRDSQQHRVARNSLRSRRSAIIKIITDTIAIRNEKLDPVLNARNMHLKIPLHDAVIMMLEYDSVTEPDIDGRTPLHWAGFRNLIEMTRPLLQYPRGCACTNQRTGPMFKERTALGMTVDKQTIELIKILSEAL